jgi:hypothetical protein
VRDEQGVEARVLQSPGEGPLPLKPAIGRH